jgi:hypothetical protein
MLLGFGLDEGDACDLLAGLGDKDFAERLVSEHTGETLYVFKPLVADTTLYLKVALREECVVISLHIDEGPDG